MRRGNRSFLLLGLVLAAAAAGLFIYFTQIPPPVPDGALIPMTATTVPLRKVVKARSDIAQNIVLTDTETFLTLADIPETEYNAAPNSYFTSPGALASKVSLRGINAEEIIRADMVIDAGLSLQIPVADAGQPRPKAIAIQVSNLTGVGDQVKPGDFVDLVMTFRVQRVVIRPAFVTDPATGVTSVQPREEVADLVTTKTLVQNVQVLSILRPPPPPEAEGTPTAAAGGAPAVDSSGQPIAPGAAAPGEGSSGFSQQGGTTRITDGFWTLMIAVTDQEAELINFARAQQPDIPITLVLRGRGDTTTETTVGATLELLLDRFGLPAPEPVRLAPQTDAQLTPLPTRTPAPTPPTTP